MNLKHIKKMRHLILATAKRYVEIETERFRQQDKAFTALAKATASYANPEAAGDELRRQAENNADDAGNIKSVAKAITEALIEKLTGGTLGAPDLAATASVPSRAASGSAKVSGAPQQSGAGREREEKL